MQVAGLIQCLVSAGSGSDACSSLRRVVLGWTDAIMHLKMHESFWGVGVGALVLEQRCSQRRDLRGWVATASPVRFSARGRPTW
jgi:hypothetical protein